MGKKKFPVRLTKEEAGAIEAAVRREGWRPHVVKRAEILLMLDENRNPGIKVREVMACLNVSEMTVIRVARQYNQEGLQDALGRQPRETRSMRRKINETVQGQIIAIACSPPPKGHSRWTLQMIRDKLLALEAVASISTEGVRQVLKRRLPVPPG